MEQKQHQLRHWTARSTLDFVHRISSDFVAQVETKLENAGISHTDLATRLGVSVGRVSQVLNDPGNLTLKNTVQYAQALGMKVAVLAYDDDDPKNKKGPISAAVFNLCWRRAGAPRDFFEFARYEGLIRQFIGAVISVRDVDILSSAENSHWQQMHTNVYLTASSAVN